MAFGREIRLYVGNFNKGNDSGENALDLSELDMEFEVTRSIEWYDNGATITLFNPSDDTLNTLMNEGNSVVLKAGYRDEGNLRNIFVGQIAMAAPQREGKDIVVVLTCVSARGAFYQLARLNCSVAFSRGKVIRDCLQELCDYAGIVLRGGDDDVMRKTLEVPFRASMNFSALIESFSRDVLFPYHRVKVYLDNNELIVIGLDNTIRLEEVVLNHDTGLLECREVRDESLNKVNFGDDPAYYFFSGSDQKVEPKERPSKEIDRTKKVHCRCLMNPAIVPNCFVQIDSSDGGATSSVLDVKGRYIVTECSYRGGKTSSDFTVEFYAQEAPYRRS